MAEPVPKNTPGKESENRLGELHGENDQISVTGFASGVCRLLLASCQNSRITYILKGRVISKQPATQQLIIDNDDIPGFMSAMTMPYAVKDPDGFQRVQPADVIRADVIVDQPGKFWLEHLTVIGKTADRALRKTQPHKSSWLATRFPMSR